METDKEFITRIMAIEEERLAKQDPNLPESDNPRRNLLRKFRLSEETIDVILSWDDDQIT